MFELTGGALSLDFVNTVDNRPSRPKELLGRYHDLLAWSRQAGALMAPEAAALERQASRRAREAAAVLDRARDLREALFTVFQAAAAGRPIPAAELAAVNPALEAALGRLRLASGPGTALTWAWAEDPSAMDRMLWPVVRSAADLLTSSDLARLRECASDGCSWLFLDRSKNGSRRWCDMTVCGNRDKVRRHRERLRKRPGLRPERGRD